MMTFLSTIRRPRISMLSAWLLGASSTLPAGSIPEALLSPPGDNGPCVVRAQFQLQDINSIDDEAETFEFTGVFVLSWKDPRQAFDPRAAGVREKIYQGDYRFNEVSPAWYPQMVLANGSGLYESDAVIFRVHPDGTGTLISTVNAVAETDFNMRRYPFDSQGLEAVHQSHCRRMRQEWKLRGR